MTIKEKTAAIKKELEYFRSNETFENEVKTLELGLKLSLKGGQLLEPPKLGDMIASLDDKFATRDFRHADEPDGHKTYILIVCLNKYHASSGDS
ncbi:MAG: Uncharacterized protein AUREO_054860 [Aureobasidium pullulans]|nr:MAG: Uncharacterized protein AUREO_054860 [Aureobasidium pullulans]